MFFQERNFSHLHKRIEEQRGGHWGSSHVYPYLFVGCLNLVLPRGKGKRLQREKGERTCFNAVVWTWIVGWFPAQSACGFHSAWHAISPQSTSSNPPPPPKCLSLSLLLSVGLNTIEFSDMHEQCRTKMWILKNQSVCEIIIPFSYRAGVGYYEWHKTTLKKTKRKHAHKPVIFLTG